MMPIGNLGLARVASRSLTSRPESLIQRCSRAPTSHVRDPSPPTVTNLSVKTNIYVLIIHAPNNMDYEFSHR